MQKKVLAMLLLGTMVIMTACGNDKAENETTEEVTTQAVTEMETTEVTEDAEENTTETEADTEAESTEATTTTEEVKLEETATEETTTEEAASDDSNYYNLCTSCSKKEVEDFAAKVKQQIIDKDWAALSENVAYPITIVGTTYNNSEEFLAADFETLCTDRFYEGVKKAETSNMFFNWKGVIIGDGEVWFSEVLNEDNTSQGLKVTALNFNIE